MEKIFAIGDIHGCLTKLQKMMSILNIDGENDVVVFIGDYIDRGPDPKGVIDYILKLKKKLKNVICLLGNHERMFINYAFHNKDKDIFFFNGGDSTVKSYGLTDTSEGIEVNVPDEHKVFFQNLLPYYETDNYIFVHAGLRPGIPLEEQEIDDLVWIREDFILSSYDFGKTVIFGHTPLDKPFFGSNKIGIDTGAVFGNFLTCLELPNKKIYQV